MKDQNERQSTIVLCMVMIVPVVWAALLAASFLSQGLWAVMKGFTEAMNDPFHIQWVEDTPKCILFFIAAYGGGIGIYLSTKRNYRKREEHGCSTMIKTVGLRQGKFDIRREATKPLFFASSDIAYSVRNDTIKL
jgi:hypothetical protein